MNIDFNTVHYTFVVPKFTCIFFICYQHENIYQLTSFGQNFISVRYNLIF